MPFLTINSITLPIALGSSAYDRKKIGEMTRAIDGTILKTVTAIKNEWQMTTAPKIATTAEALASLVDGEGYSWSFDVDLYSDGKGLGKSASTGATRTTASPAPKFGAGQLNLAATTGTITYPTNLGSYWTVMVWRSINAGAWNHWIVRNSNGTVLSWLNGVADAAAIPSWMSVAAGSLTLANTSGTADQYDDLVALPYLIPSDGTATASVDNWAPTWGTLTAAFPALPKLSIGGTMLRNSVALTVQGETTRMKNMGFQSGGAWQANGKTMDFRIEEV